MKRADLIAPAIELAEHGFVLDRGDAEMFAVANTALKADPATRAIFLRPDGREWGIGDRLVQKDLAATLRQIREAGAAGFYQGPVARALVASSRAGKGPDHAGRSRSLHGARAGADRVRLSRLSHRLGAATELGRRRGVRDPQRPRGLSAQGLGLPLGAGRARPDRGDAPCLRRPQRRSRRPGLRQEPARTAARQGVRGTDPRRDRSGEGTALERPGAGRRAPRRQQHDPLLDRRRAWQRRRRDLHAQRLVRRQGHRRRYRRPAQQRDGRLQRQARHRQRASAWSRAKPTRSRPASGRSAR